METVIFIILAIIALYAIVMMIMCLIDGFRSIIYQYRPKNIEIKCSTPVSANSTLSAKNTEATVIYHSIYVDGKRLSSQFEDETNSINRATQSINTVAAIM